MQKLWKIIKSIFKEACENAFSPYPFHIVGKNIDNLTLRATFILKAKRISTPYSLKTQEIMHDDRFLLGLPGKDRAEIIGQFLKEINQPLACIHEIPLHHNENNEYIFKVLCYESRKIISGSATHFMRQGKDFLNTLSREDIIQLSKAYTLEQIKKESSNFMISNPQNNVIFIHEH